MKVCEIDNKFDIYIITWLPNQKTPIHDHAKYGCILKVLEGELEETIYQYSSKLITKKNNKKGDTGFMSDEIGVHLIENKSDSIAVSLHIYSPNNHQTSSYNPIIFKTYSDN